MARDSFIFYRSFYEAIKEIPAEEQLQVYKAISIYALEQEEIGLSGIAKAIFSLIKPQLDANYKKYENGKQSKSKTKANYKQNESKTETNVNDNENVNVNENNNDNKSDSCIDGSQNASESCVDGLQSIVDFYENNIGLLSPYGLEIIKSYLEKMPADVVIYAIQISIEANKKTIQYIKGILNNWEKAGIKTLVEAKEESKNKTKKTEKKNNFTERKYDDLNDFYVNIKKGDNK